MKKILLCAALLTASAFAAGEFDPNTFKSIVEDIVFLYKLNLITKL